MGCSLFEHQLESAMRDAIGETGIRVIKGVDKIASKQGGENAIHNYQLLGKRALIVLGAVFVGVQVVSSVAGFVISRRSEERRIERVVRRVLEEERQQVESETE